MSGAIDYNYFKEEVIDRKIYYISPWENPIHERIMENVISNVSILRDEIKFTKRGHQKSYVKLEAYDKERFNKDDKVEFRFPFKISIFKD